MCYYVYSVLYVITLAFTHSITFYYYHLLTKPLNKERNSSGLPFLLVRGFVASPLFPPTRISELKLTRHRSKATPLKPSETNRKEISGTWKVATERTITPIGTPSKMVFPTEGKIFPSLSTPLRRLLSPNAPWVPNKYDADAQPRINGDAASDDIDRVQTFPVTRTPNRREHRKCSHVAGEKYSSSFQNVRLRRFARLVVDVRHTLEPRLLQRNHFHLWIFFSRFFQDLLGDFSRGHRWSGPERRRGGFASGSRRLNLLLPPPLLLLSAAQTTFVPPFLDDDEAVVVIHFW